MSYRFKNSYIYDSFKSYKSLMDTAIDKNNLRQILQKLFRIFFSNITCVALTVHTQLQFISLINLFFLLFYFVVAVICKFLTQEIFTIANWQYYITCKVQLDKDLQQFFKYSLKTVYDVTFLEQIIVIVSIYN